MRSPFLHQFSACGAERCTVSFPRRTKGISGGDWRSRKREALKIYFYSRVSHPVRFQAARILRNCSWSSAGKAEAKELNSVGQQSFRRRAARTMEALTASLES